MEKKIRRLIINGQMEIGKTENWLHDLSEKGLHLKKLGSLFATFEKGEPRNINYRIDIIERKKREKKIKFHENNGWKFISNLNDFHVFSSINNSELKELYEDPKEQFEYISHLYKKAKSNTIIGIIALILFLGMMIPLLLLDNFYLRMVEGYVLNQILIIIFQMYVFYSIFKNYFLTKKLKKCVSKGEWINHNEPYRTSRRRAIIFYLLYFPLFILIITLPLIEISKDYRYELPYEKNQLPVARLYDIEKNDDLVRAERDIGDEIDFFNQVDYNWSLLAPIQYEIQERGEISNVMWNDGSGKYSPSISTRFYELRFSFMSENLLNDIINRYVWRDEDKVIKKTSDYFDVLYITINDEKKQIFGCKDNYVIYVRYYGYGSEEDLEEQIIYEMDRYIKNL